jgi:hypothetical protein
VFVLQKKAIRMINGLKYNESCRNAFKELDILPLPALYIYKVLIFARQYSHFFVDSKIVSDYNMRNSNLFRLPHDKTVLYEKGLLYSCLKFSNNLPKIFTTIYNLAVYKKELKKYLLKKDIYKISDFFAE